MSETIFSTADLVATWTGLTAAVSPAKLTTTRYSPQSGPSPVSPGSIGTPTYPAQNATDGNNTTVADVALDEGMGDYLVVDMGAPINVAEVQLKNVNYGAGMQVQVYVGTVKTDAPGSPSMTQIGSNQGGDFSASNLSFSTEDGTALTGRYLFVACSVGGGDSGVATIGEVVPMQALGYFAGDIVFGVMQDIQFAAAWTRKDLYDAAQNSIFAVDSADHEGKFDITAKSTTIDAAHMQLLVAAQVSQATEGGNAATLATLLNNVQLPYFKTSVSLLSTGGDTIVITAGSCKAQGVSLPAKLEDYVVADFKVSCYPDGNGVVATLAYEG